MKIYFSSNHKYPGRLHGVAAHQVHDYLVKGLVELGHDVYYNIQEPPELPLPDGVIYTKDIVRDVDIFHINDGPLDRSFDANMPWVKIIHSDIRIQGLSLELAVRNWVYVSKTLAALYKSDSYVLNGIDPDLFEYSESKQDYFLFLLGGIKRAEMKGIDTALSLCKKADIELRVAATSDSKKDVEEFSDYCTNNGAIYIGPIFGDRKSKLLADAAGLLFPSKFNEACPLVVAEAMMSGTPVISSNNGAMPELITPDAGFVCNSEEDYLNAINNVSNIKPWNCRALAMEKFHYLNMAKGYERIYKSEIERISSKELSNTI